MHLILKGFNNFTLHKILNRFHSTKMGKNINDENRNLHFYSL